jgi:hypothetical protein
LTSSKPGIDASKTILPFLVENIFCPIVSWRRVGVE